MMILTAGTCIEAASTAGQGLAEGAPVSVEIWLPPVLHLTGHPPPLRGRLDYAYGFYQQPRHRAVLSCHRSSPPQVHSACPMPG